MENKCNKTPNNNAHKYLDHMYCNTGVVGGTIVTAPENKSFIRGNTITTSNGGVNSPVATNGDILALFKENKQLKAMLILHLELIQEQSDQLVAKDKQLSSQSEELEKLRASNTKLAEQVLELQNQLHRQLRRTAFVGELSQIPPPPLAKIQCKPQIIRQSTAPNLTTLTTPKTTIPNIIGECNGKLINKIILQRVNPKAGECPPITNSCFTVSAGTAGIANVFAKKEDEVKKDVVQEKVEVDEASTEDSNDTDNNALSELIKKKRQRLSQNLKLKCGAKLRQPLTAATSSSTTAPVQVCVTPPTPSRGKQMSMMLWHMPEAHSDESGSCDSMVDLEQSLQHSPSLVSPATFTGNVSPAAKRTATPNIKRGDRTHAMHAKLRRCSYITTSQLYCTREWEEEAASVCDYEFTKEDANELHVDAPMLEIPKWTEHELNASYCIEGTEDLSDEIFHKRHAKFEIDEKRRKKWDVQQIREQRRIEKLKRRHCKDELKNPIDQKPAMSFYPQVDALQMICYMNDLPVQAFGEMIPRYTINTHFGLPWRDALFAKEYLKNCSEHMSTCNTVKTLAEGNACSTSTQAHAQVLKSIFVYLKKRRRQRSFSSRQRSAVKLATQANLAACVNSPALPASEGGSIEAIK